MPFPKIDISPLVAVIVYDLEGINIFELEQIINEFEKEEVHRYFIQPIEFYQWVRRYNEITIFRGKYRATYITFFDVTILFVSRVENISAEVRPRILEYIKLLGSTILNTLTHDTPSKLIKTVMKKIRDVTVYREELNKVFTRVGIEKLEKEVVPPGEIEEQEIVPTIKTVEQERMETRLETYEKIRPFETVPKIPASEMTQEILDEANKRAITSLLFSSIRGCNASAASAYIFPKEDGVMGELYAGNLEERKIIYVLETITKFPRVIYEMIRSEDEIKALNAGVVQIIVEDCSEGKLLIGMTTNVNDVINVGYKFKIVKHILNTMGF
ncbi:MAG: hypothetical protein H7645_01535 [Candidatus Heimdallarchaeota archaeon]|nr:hypothetical protein [Candidatus Heimdallarchaeota archaeon]MCK4768998.1 hypothetical protein [Candidatus Heimdallarchaeota archaeon]